METFEWLQMIGLMFQAYSLVFGLVLIFPVLAKGIAWSNVGSDNAHAGCAAMVVYVIVIGAATYAAESVVVGRPPAWVFAVLYVGIFVPIGMVFTHLTANRVLESLAGAISILGVGAIFQLISFVLQR